MLSAPAPAPTSVATSITARCLGCFAAGAVAAASFAIAGVVTGAPFAVAVGSIAVGATTALAAGGLFLGRLGLGGVLQEGFDVKMGHDVDGTLSRE